MNLSKLNANLYNLKNKINESFEDSDEEIFGNDENTRIKKPLVDLFQRQAYLGKDFDEILRYGNNQLKIELNPPSNSTIIISKNKAAEFKKWLDI